MKQLITFSFIALLAFGACKKTNSNPGAIEIRFVNMANEQLSNMEITDAKKSIGSLEAGSGTDYVSFKHFKTDTDMPDEVFAATINGEHYFGDAKYHWCGTEKSQLKAGKYTIGIYKPENNNENLLILRFREN